MYSNQVKIFLKRYTNIYKAEECIPKPEWLDYEAHLYRVFFLWVSKITWSVVRANMNSDAVNQKAKTIISTKKVTVLTHPADYFYVIGTVKCIQI